MKSLKKSKYMCRLKNLYIFLKLEQELKCKMHRLSRLFVKCFINNIKASRALERGNVLVIQTALRFNEAKRSC